MIGQPGFFCAHNHPSGDSSPSRADIAVTRQLREAGQPMGIPDGIYSVIETGQKAEKVTSPIGGKFADHQVKIAVKDHMVAGKSDLKGFCNRSGVFVKIPKE